MARRNRLSLNPFRTHLAPGLLLFSSLIALSSCGNSEKVVRVPTQRGIVLHKESLLPLSGVTVQSRRGPAFRQTTTDAKGAFELPAFSSFRSHTGDFVSEKELQELRQPLLISFSKKDFHPIRLVFRPGTNTLDTPLPNPLSVKLKPLLKLPSFPTNKKHH